MDRVTGQWDWQPVLITFAVMMWAGGFETIYGTLDYDFDQENNINSIASRFGVRNAIRTTRVLAHPGGGGITGGGHLAATERLLLHRLGGGGNTAVYENNMVKSGEPAKIGKAFAFNKYISTQLLGFTVLAVALPFDGFLPFL